MLILCLILIIWILSDQRQDKEKHAYNDQISKYNFHNYKNLQMVTFLSVFKTGSVLFKVNPSPLLKFQFSFFLDQFLLYFLTGRLVQTFQKILHSLFRLTHIFTYSFGFHIRPGSLYFLFRNLVLALHI